MEKSPYGMVCPITHACEVLEPRWTIPILSEMWAGSTRFNDIRRGVGNISTALLSRRLKELEANGLVERVEDRASGTVDYFRTEKAIKLEPALDALAHWALRCLTPEETIATTDVSTLMWKMQGYILTDSFPRKRVVIRFHFLDEGLDYDTYWAIAKPGTPVETCSSVPNFDVDLYVETWVPVLPAILSGRSTVAREIEADRLFLSGDARLARTMQSWLCKSGYADAVDDIQQVRADPGPDALGCTGSARAASR